MKKEVKMRSTKHEKVDKVRNMRKHEKACAGH